MFRQDGFIQQFEVVRDGRYTVVVAQMNMIEVMPPSEMELLRQKFDSLEATRENKKFISQEINLHFTHR